MINPPDEEAAVGPTGGESSKERRKNIVPGIHILKIPGVLEGAAAAMAARPPRPELSEADERRQLAARRLSRVGESLGQFGVTVELCQHSFVERTLVPNFRLSHEDAKRLGSVLAALVKAGAMVRAKPRDLPVKTQQDALRWLLQNLRPMSSVGEVTPADAVTGTGGVTPPAQAGKMPAPQPEAEGPAVAKVGAPSGVHREGIRAHKLKTAGRSKK